MCMVRNSFVCISIQLVMYGSQSQSQKATYYAASGFSSDESPLLKLLSIHIPWVKKVILGLITNFADCPESRSEEHLF